MKIFTTTVVQAIKQCIGHPWVVVIIAILLTAGSVGYSVRHFALNTNINKLISPNFPWRQREIAFDALFPTYDLIIAVVQAPTPEQTGQATAALVDRLARHEFHQVDRRGGRRRVPCPQRASVPVHGPAQDHDGATGRSGAADPGARQRSEPAWDRSDTVVRRHGDGERTDHARCHDASDDHGVRDTRAGTRS